MFAPFLKKIAGLIIKIILLACKLTKIKGTIACKLSKEEGLGSFYTERFWFVLVIQW